MLAKLLERANETVPISITDWAKMFRPGAQVNYAGRNYQAYKVADTSAPGAAYYDSNAVVFACEANRVLLFSEARFAFQRMRSGRPGDLFSNPDLALLEQPWPGASTRDLLAQAELDVLAAGNSYWVRNEDGLLRLDPARVKILTIAAFESDITGYMVGERIGAYIYEANGEQLAVYQPDEVAHYKPYPNLSNRFLGMSWISACIDDVVSDASLTGHKQSQMSNGAQIPFAITFDKDMSVDQLNEYVDAYRRTHEGAQNAGKALFLGGGADIKTVGQTFEQLSLKAVQGAGETRIAADAGVPPVIVGLSEGLSSATYSNYSQARRRLVDGTMRPLWGFFASAFQSIIPTPPDARLWYDDRDIPFLREDVTDQAAIMTADAGTLAALVAAGFHPDAAIDAVKSGDLGRLTGTHSGLFSVQLQPPGSSEPSANGDQPAVPATNGSTA